jgi:hypothetical protein
VKSPAFLGFPLMPRRYVQVKHEGGSDHQSPRLSKGAVPGNTLSLYGVAVDSDNSSSVLCCCKNIRRLGYYRLYSPLFFQ